MSTKDLFNKSNKVLTKSQEEKIKKDLESPELTRDVVRSNNKFHSHVDFSKPENFSFYGSAQKYYEDSFNRIYQTYPYDGSQSEKEKWFYDSSELDLWILDNVYPKSTGYVRLGSDQSIFVKGGPNKEPSVVEGEKEELSKQFPVKQGNSNIWNPSIYRNSNLHMDPNLGFTVEFWMKFDNPESQNLTPFIIGNLIGERLNIRSFGFNSGMLNISFFDDAFGGGTSFNATGLNNFFETTWNHYSFSFINSEDKVKTEIYKNGVLVKSFLNGTSLGTISQEQLYLNINGSMSSINGSRSNVVDGMYVDEFRFWKRKRTVEEIGRHWNTNIHGGTNTDDNKYNLENRKVDIGVYYKFNEGITGDNSIDSTVLDYSGRISNGEIINYNRFVRNTGSALDESGLLEVLEEKDPIIYSSHPDFIFTKESYMKEGLSYDYTNNSSIYHTMPAWITEEDEQKGENIKELSQVISSYFDSAQIKIKELVNLKDVEYYTLEEKTSKPYSLIRRTLESAGMVVPDLFTEASAFEEILSRDEKGKFEEKLQDVKNTIYQNIYNNLSYIYKSKGTEKAFRNLIRCFGIDDELVKINLYSDGADYTLEDTRRTTSIKKKFVDFNNADRDQGIVYTKEDTNNANSTSYIKGVGNIRTPNISFTFETEVIFPKSIPTEHPNYDPPTNVEEHIAFVGEYDDGYTTNSIFDLKAVKENNDPLSENVKFVLDFNGQEIETEFFKSVYENSKWNIAVRLVPKKRLSSVVAGGSSTDFTAELYCVRMLADVVEDEEWIVATVLESDARSILAKDKYVSIGALHSTEDETDPEINIINPEIESVEKETRIKISSTLFWYDNVVNEEIRAHGSDASNFGRLHPNDEAYMFDKEFNTGSSSAIQVLNRDTLAMHWDFSEVTTTDENKQFIVEDLSQSIQKNIVPVNQNSIHFDGTNDFIEVGDHEVFSFVGENPGVDKSFSVSAWVFRDGVASQGVFLAKNSGNGKPSDWFFGHQFGTIQVRIYDGQGVNSQSIGQDSPNSALPANEWHLVTFTYDGSRTDAGIKIYIDDVLQVPDPVGAATYNGRIDTNSPLRLGANAATAANLGNLFESNLADCYIFKTDLSQVEVEELYNNGSVKDLKLHSMYEEVVSWWKMGDDEDTTGADGIKDYVGQFHGTLTNGASIQTEPSLASDDLLLGRFGWFTELVGNEVTGRGAHFTENDTQIVNREFIYSAKHRAPEVINSEDLVEIRTQDDLTFTKDAQVVTHFFAAEKSMYQVISDDMINLFATIVEFNDLIGQPVNRYRLQYKALEKFRARYFEKVKNVPSLEKYVELYKWIDSSIGMMLQELIPVSSNFSANLRTMIESHIFERNKYWTKFPTFEMAGEPPLGIVKGINELTYNWKDGHVPIGTETIEDDKFLWGDQRVQGRDPLVTTGDNAVDDNREILRRVSTRTTEGSSQVVERNNVFVEEDKPLLRKSPVSEGVPGAVYSGQAYVTRALSKPYKLNLDIAPTIHGGANYSPTTKDPNAFVRASTKVSSSSGITVTFGTNPVVYQGFSHDEQSVKRSINIVVEDALVDFGADGDFIYPYYETIADPTPEITNLQNDSYGDDAEIPMQGPFTETWVGGNQHRHVDFVTQTDRPELFLDDAGTLRHPFELSEPAARYTRDEVAKRPINIRNIKTGESRLLGNYARDYEIVQTSSRTKNNRWFVKNEGVSDTLTTAPIEGIQDFELPDRTKDSKGEVFGKSKHVIVERFSAPGDPLTLSRGYLDRAAEEYSVYNSINFRNLTERTEHTSELTSHSAVYHGSQGYVFDTNGLASVHKVNRNTNHNPYGKTHDNAFISYQIPRSDFQYNVPMLTETRVAFDFNFQSDFDEFTFSNSTTSLGAFTFDNQVATIDDPPPGSGDYKFIEYKQPVVSKAVVSFELEPDSGNSLGDRLFLQYKLDDSDWTTIEIFEHDTHYKIGDYEYSNEIDLGQNIYKPLYLRWVVHQMPSSSAIWTLDKISIFQTSFQTYLNSIDTSKGRNDYADYQGAGYRFIKNSEKNQVINQRKNNTYSQLDRLPSNGSQQRTTNTFIEPAVVWNKPNTHYVLNEEYDEKIRNAEAGSLINVNIDKGSLPITYSYSNNLEMFSNEDFERAVDIDKVSGAEFLNTLMETFKKAELLFSRSTARQIVYPKHKNVGLKKIRNRGYFDSYKFFWKDKMFDRIKCSNTTKLGFEMTPEFQKLFNQKYSVDVVDNFHYKQSVNIAHFDGDFNTFISVPDSDDLSFTTNDGSPPAPAQDKPFSISLWVKPQEEVNGVSTIFDKFDGQSEYFFYIFEESVTFGLTEADTDDLGRAQAHFDIRLDIGEWNNFVITYDGTEQASGIKFYKNSRNYNAVQPVTNTNYDGMSNQTGELRIGAGFPGFIKDVVIYNKELSQEEVLSIYGEVYPDNTDIVSFWKLNGNADDSVGTNNGTASVGSIFETTEESYRVVGDLTYMGEDRMRHMITRKDIGPLHTGSSTLFYGLEQLCESTIGSTDIVPVYSSDEIDRNKRAPIPSAQLYHNPYNEEYKESQGWINRKTIASENKPTYNDYDSFSEDIKLAAQNYGLVSEFRISEHMDKYILENGGNFRVKNYDFLTLDGASHDGDFHTLSSGTSVKETSSFYSLKKNDDSLTLTAYPTSSAEALTMLVKNNAEGYFNFNPIFSPSGSDFEISNSVNSEIEIDETIITNYSGIVPYQSGLNAAGKFNLYSANTDYLSIIPNMIDLDSLESGDNTSLYLAHENDLATALPITISVWAQPEKLQTGDETQQSKCLWTMGSPIGDLFSSTMHLFSEYHYADANFNYENLGLTFVVSEDLNRPKNEGLPITSPTITDDSSVYTFFRRDGRPAKLNSGSMNSVIFQFINPSEASTKNPLIKIWLNGEETYGVHIREFEDTIYSNRLDFGKSINGYSPCPIGQWLESGGDKPWNTDYDSAITLEGSIRGFEQVDSFILGHGDWRDSSTAKFKFRGLLDELTIFRGILPASSVQAIYNNGIPNNVNELVENKQVVGNCLESGSVTLGGFSYAGITVPPVTLPSSVDNEEFSLLSYQNYSSLTPVFQDNLQSYNVGQAVNQSILPPVRYIVGTDPNGNVNGVIKKHVSQANKIFALSGTPFDPSNVNDPPVNDPPSTPLSSPKWRFIELFNLTSVKVVSFRVYEGTGVNNSDPYGLGSPEENENLWFQYSVDSGTNWNTVAQFTDAENHDLSVVHHINLSTGTEPLTSPNGIRLRWISATENNPQDDHWGIDDITVYTHETIEEANLGLSVIGITPGLLPVIDDTQFIDNYSVEKQEEIQATLPVWHRIGVPSYNTVVGEGGWREDFFDSYVHTDNLNFIEKADRKHNELSINTKERLKLKVNAIKKLLPYEGFYPQDRTIQLANLFVEKISPDIVYGENVCKEQAIQAALQHFFAPGILYNSIKAGIACDWASYTNESGLQPTHFGSKINLSDENGVPVTQYNPTAYAPDWYQRAVLSPDDLQSEYPNNLDSDILLIFNPSLALSDDVSVNSINKKGSEFSINWDYNIDISVRDLIISRSPNLRLPFESILDPYKYLNNGRDGTIVSDEDDEYSLFNRANNFYLMNPSYYENIVKFNVNQQGGTPPTQNVTIDDNFSQYKNYNFPYFRIKNYNSSDFRYELASNNFIAEATKFFIKDEKLSSFASSIPQADGYFFESGTIYYMDVVLEKNENFKPVRTPSGAPGGRYFGPPHKWIEGTKYYGDSAEKIKDPAYAPYTPPYFYGDSAIRIAFAPTQTKKYSLDDIFQNVTTTEISEATDNLFLNSSLTRNNIDLITGETNEPDDGGYKSSPAYQSKMPLSASIELFGKTKLSRQEFDAEGNPTAISTANSEELDTWVIYTKFECPLFDFSDKFNDSSEGNLSNFKISKDTVEAKTAGNYDYASSYLDATNMDRFTTDKRTGSGIWAGLGKQIDGRGVTISIRESFPKNTDSNVGSLLEICGFTPETKQIGRLADSREISEAVLMIPFVDKPITAVETNGPVRVINNETIQVDDRNFIKVDEREYREQMRKFVRGEVIYTTDDGVEVRETSITNMLEGMKKYNVPPLYDFNQFNEAPFVMYFFEFKHNLDREDLSNIWQGLQPKIAKEASLDSVEISHEINKHELFGNLGEIPKGVRWMVFKVKKKAEKSYYNLTEDSRDDSRFKFDFEVGTKVPEYGYNYPYDYFTMLEMIEVEVDSEKEIEPLDQLNRARTRDED